MIKKMKLHAVITLCHYFNNTILPNKTSLYHIYTKILQCS